MKIKIKILIFSLLLFAGCSQEDPYGNLTELPAPQEPNMTTATEDKKVSETPKYVYPYPTERDPFFPLIGGKNSGTSRSGGAETFASNLPLLALKGILKDPQGKIAILATPYGDTFTLRGNRIYDRKDTMVKEITGIIKQDKVLLISASQTIKELKLEPKYYGK